MKTILARSNFFEAPKGTDRLEINGNSHRGARGNLSCEGAQMSARDSLLESLPVRANPHRFVGRRFGTTSLKSAKPFHWGSVAAAFSRGR